MLRLSPSLVWLLVLSGAGCSDFKVNELEPRLSVTPKVVDFGAVPAGTEGIAQVGVVNSGAAPLTFVDPIITVDGLGSLTAVLDRPTLEPGDAGTLTLTYIPAGEESDAGTVLVGDTTGLSQEVVWSGTGVVGWLQAAPSALDFGSLRVGESAEQVLALTNTGLASVTVDALTVDGDAGFTAAPMSGGLPFTIPAGSTTVAWVTYTADALDPAAATLAIHSDDPHADTLIVPLTANTEAPNNRPVISLLSPADGDTLSIGQAYTLRAYALDAETPAEDLEVTFSSALQGTLGVVHPDASGEALLDATATVLGDDVITATVVDLDGSDNADAAAIIVTDCMELSWDRSETFDSTFDDSLFAMDGTAYVDETTQELVLTDNVAWSAGAIYLRAPILLQRFHVAVEFHIDLGTGADGMAIVAATGADPEDMLGRTGEQLGVGAIPGVTGFAIEVDVHSNASRSDPSADHIALVSLPDYEHVGTPAEVDDLETGEPHELVVDFDEGIVEVSLDGTVVLTETVPDWVEFEGYLGATAATGSAYDRHVLGRWDVLTGCW
jgi:hypothetical protein